jgi:hypothetical protein
MPCSCGTKKPQVSKTYVYTSGTGETKTYRSEVEAAAAVKRTGGTYRPQ